MGGPDPDSHSKPTADSNPDRPDAAGRSPPRRYRYSITLPTGGWRRPARATWDGTTTPTSTTQWSTPSGPLTIVDAFVSAAAHHQAHCRLGSPTASQTNTRGPHRRFPAARTSRCHDSVESITIGGQPGTLVGFKNCFFVNMAFAVVNGDGYRFAFRDPVSHDIHPRSRPCLGPSSSTSGELLHRPSRASAVPDDRSRRTERRLSPGTPPARAPRSSGPRRGRPRRGSHEYG